MSLERTQIYRNAMESLVVEEVELQLQTLPPQLAAEVNKVEAIAYALNFLPALYATTEKGWQWQRLRGRNELREQVVEAVRQGLAAVYYNRQPLSTPLKAAASGTADPAELALQRLKELLQEPDLSWQNVVSVVERNLIQTARGKSRWYKQVLESLTH